MTMYADYDFVENQDYISFHKKMERVVGGTNLWGMKIKTLFGFHKIMKPKERYEFVENQDFVWVPQNCGTQRAVRLCGKPRLCDFFRKL